LHPVGATERPQSAQKTQRGRRIIEGAKAKDRATDGRRLLRIVNPRSGAWSGGLMTAAVEAILKGGCLKSIAARQEFDDM
jgi:hypothetical protein